MPNTLIPNLPNAEYHGHSAISNSRLSRFVSSPRLLDVPMKPTAALRWGTLVHTALLEPDLFAQTVVAMPEGLDKGTGAKARVAEFEAANAGKEVIDSAEAASLQAVLKRVREDEFAMDLLGAPGRTEQSLFWTDAQTGIELRCRPDYWRDDGIVVDVKTTADCSSYQFGKSALDFGYDRQAAIYWDGIEAVTGKAPTAFVFIAIEHTKTSGETYVQCHNVEAETLMRGRERYRKALADLKMCREKYGMESARYPHTLEASIRPLRVPYHFLNQ